MVKDYKKYAKGSNFNKFYILIFIFETKLRIRNTQNFFQLQ